MAGRGVLFALDELTAYKLLKLSPQQRVDLIQNELEEEFFEHQPKYLAETDKAWDAIHRSLTDGRLDWDNGQYPLNHLILGGDTLCGTEETDDYIIILKNPQQVKDISTALQKFDKEQFTQGYAQIDIEDYEYHLGFEDLEYSYKWFCSIQDFWQSAAEENRYVIFTVAL